MPASGLGDFTPAEFWLAVNLIDQTLQAITSRMRLKLPKITFQIGFTRTDDNAHRGEWSAFSRHDRPFVAMGAVDERVLVHEIGHIVASHVLTSSKFSVFENLYRQAMERVATVSLITVWQAHGQKWYNSFIPSRRSLVNVDEYAAEIFAACFFGPRTIPNNRRKELHQLGYLR